MFPKRITSPLMASPLLLLLLTCAAALPSHAQQTIAVPSAQSAQSASPPRDEQDAVKIFTEEVRLPVAAYNDRGRFDPTVSPDDILLLEDNLPQQVRSVRRVPANILLLLDLGSQITATKSTSTTRDIALRLIATLGEADQVAIVQNSTRVELLQDWTTDKKRLEHVLKTKFFTSSRSRLSECLTLAADKLSAQPAGNTHVIVFTDGLEVQSKTVMQAEAIRKEVLQKLVATQASVHVISYAALVQNVRVGFGLDFEMRRWYKNYTKATNQSVERLIQLAQETGGRLLQPTSTEDTVELAGEVARDIGAQYVVTYTPKRPFAFTDEIARRQVRVFPRRGGLRLVALRNYVTAPTR